MAPIEGPTTHDTLRKSSNPPAPAFGSKNPLQLLLSGQKKETKQTWYANHPSAQIPPQINYPDILQGIYISGFDLIHPVPPKKTGDLDQPQYSRSPWGDV